MAANIEADPELAIRHQSTQLVIGKESTRLILWLYLGVYPYKIMLSQESQTNDHEYCRENTGNFDPRFGFQPKKSSSGTGPIFDLIDM